MTELYSRDREGKKRKKWSACQVSREKNRLAPVRSYISKDDHSDHIVPGSPVLRAFIILQMNRKGANWKCILKAKNIFYLSTLASMQANENSVKGEITITAGYGGDFILSHRFSPLSPSLSSSSLTPSVSRCSQSVTSERERGREAIIYLNNANNWKEGQF